MKHFIYLYYGFPSKIEEKIELIKNNKFNGVFLFWDGYFLNNVGKIKEANLEIETVHLPFDNCNELWVPGKKGDDYVETIIEAIKQISSEGIKTVIFHVSSGDMPPSYNEFGLMRLEKILKVVEEHRVYFALENLRRLDYLDYVYDNLANKYLKFCFDSGHANAFTKNIENFPWEKYQDKLLCVHLHDNNSYTDQHLIPFRGNINWQLLAQKLKEINYQGPLTCEAVNTNSLNNEREYVEEIKLSLERIESYMG